MVRSAINFLLLTNSQTVILWSFPQKTAMKGRDSRVFKKEEVVKEQQPRLLHVDDELVSKIESVLRRVYEMEQVPRSSCSQNVMTDVENSGTPQMRDVFTGSLWQPLSSDKQESLNVALTQELINQQRTRNPKILNIRRLTEKLPVADFR